jgi:O-antigen/teichoic acid export membrane protein
VTRETGVLRRLLLYGASRAVTEGLLSARGLVLATLLGPAGFGAWALFRLAMRWTSFLGVAVLRGVEVEVAAERRDEDPARTALGFILVSFGVLAAGAAGASFLVENPAVVVALRTLAVVLVTDNVVLYALAVLRSRGDLRFYGVLETTMAALHVVLALGLAVRGGLPGALAGFTLASLAGVAIALPRVPHRPALDGAVLRRLLGIGTPLGVTVVLGFALTTADRLVVGAAGGTELLGLYAFGVAVSGFTGSLAWVIRTVVFPGVFRGAAAEGAGPALTAHFRKKVLPLAWVLPVTFGAAALAVGPAISLVLPEYAPAAPVARWMILTATTAMLTSLGVVGVTAAGRQRALPFVSGAALVLNVGWSYLALRGGWGIEAVAAGALACRALNSAAILALVAGAAGLPRIRTLLDGLFPLVWTAVAVLVVQVRFAPTTAGETGVALLVYAAAVGPLLPRCVIFVRSAFRSRPASAS